MDPKTGQRDHRATIPTWTATSTIPMNAPDGGGGSGFFAAPGPAGHTPSKSKSNQGKKETLSARWPVIFAEFNKTKGKYVEEIKSYPLGVHPVGNLPFVNAVELIFKVDQPSATKLGLKSYRCKQKVYGMGLWEKELKGGKLTNWNKTMTAGSSSDDPDDLLQATTPPLLAFYDQPGIMDLAKETQLKGPQGKLTSKVAAMIFFQQNFICGIEGSRKLGSEVRWERVSEEVKWHSNQSLKRDFKKSEWTYADGSEIALGHTQGPPK